MYKLFLNLEIVLGFLKIKLMIYGKVCIILTYTYCNTINAKSIENPIIGMSFEIHFYVTDQ